MFEIYLSSELLGLSRPDDWSAKRGTLLGTGRVRATRGQGMAAAIATGPYARILVILNLLKARHATD